MSLIIFTRYPEPGRTKTRLIAAIGAEGAADLHRHMAEHALSLAKGSAAYQDVEIKVYYDGGDQRLFESWLGHDLTYVAQQGDDLGKRMAEAFVETFHESEEPVIIIGTDCPDLTTGVMDEAFRLLSCSDLVLGPAADGGYYLIGLNHPIPELFEGVHWGTNEVLSKTQAIAHSLGLKVSMLETLNDIDRPEDLVSWQPPWE